MARNDTIKADATRYNLALTEERNKLVRRAQRWGRQHEFKLSTAEVIELALRRFLDSEEDST